MALLKNYFPTMLLKKLISAHKEDLFLKGGDDGLITVEYSENLNDKKEKGEKH